MQTLEELLNQELMLFRAALDTERRKRRAILSADGKRLNELTAKTEMFLNEAQALEGKREIAVRAMIDRYKIEDSHETLTLRRVVRLIEANADPAESMGLKDVAEEFRSTVFALKRESAENNQLMSDTRHRIHDLLTGISDPAEEDKTYNPANKASAKKNQSSKALLLNANA
ncbi:MAG: flagellar protein FlgN [bacterium]|nr:flagellar protein FlgN [bacterium]